MTRIHTDRSSMDDSSGNSEWPRPERQDQT